MTFPSMLTFIPYRLLLAASAAFACLVTAPAAQAMITASTASDVCPLDADPCLITQTVNVTNGAILDFGLRAVSIVGAGSLDFAAGGTIRCGSFSATPNSTAMVSRGTVRIDARRVCSGDSSRLCARDSVCDRGPCNPRRCTDSSRSFVDCQADQDCSGRCVASSCTNAPEAGCFLHTNCNFGTCEAERRCDLEDDLFCGDDSDCGFGACSVGTGDIIFDKRIAGNSATPGRVILVAAGRLELNDAVSISSDDTESDGGTLTLSSQNGPVEIRGKISLVGGGQSSGGELTVRAGTDLLLVGEVDASGGDFDGGILELEALQSVTLGSDINVNSSSGAGFGGEILVVAGKDIIFTSGSPGNRNVLSADGHADSENFAGDGGILELEAGGNIEFRPFVSFVARGAAPDADGGEFSATSVEDTLLAGDITLTGKGQSGGGGVFSVSAAGAVDFASTGVLDASGNRGGGGEVSIDVVGDAILAGAIHAAAVSGFSAGAVALVSEGDVEISGSISNGGTFGDEAILINACRVNVVSGALLQNSAVDGLTQLTLRESGEIATGASLFTDGSGGGNRIVYRDPAKPPVLNGVIAPAAELVVNEALVGCPVCGNGELDQGETCDDGNLESGDGCTSECVNEGCIAGSVNYPDEPLCSDGSGCTQDSCDIGSSTCVNEFLCDDEIACTQDLCVDDLCVYTPSHALCADGNLCTDDLCIEDSGCVNPTNTLQCEDGLFCTVDDRCDAGACQGQPNACDDGVTCTVDSCDEGNARCSNTPSQAACDNGLFCDGVEQCRAIQGCVTATPVDCSAESNQCQAGFCDEALDACSSSNTNEGQACDDADPCTTGDSCAGGKCVGTGTPNCGVCGNGLVEPTFSEDCDDGDALFELGEACSALCKFIPCGKPTDSRGVRPSAPDALFTLRAAVLLVSCVKSTCDVDGNGSLFASDALLILQAAVGLPVVLRCPAPI